MLHGEVGDHSKHFEEKQSEALSASGSILMLAIETEAVEETNATSFSVTFADPYFLSELNKSRV
jgi:hypothetical protein